MKIPLAIPLILTPLLLINSLAIKIAIIFVWLFSFMYYFLVYANTRQIMLMGLPILTTIILIKAQSIFQTILPNYILMFLAVLSLWSIVLTSTSFFTMPKNNDE